MERFTKVAVIPVFLFLFLAGAVQSQAEYTTNEAEFMAEYPNLMVQDFSQSKVAPHDTEACESPADFESNDNCFSPGDIMQGLDFVSGLGPQKLRIMGVDFVSESLQALNNPYNSLFGNDGDSFRVVLGEEKYNVVGLKIGCVTKGVNLCEQEMLVETLGFGGGTIGMQYIVVDSTFTTFLGISYDEPISSVRISPADGSEGFQGVSVVYFGRSHSVPTLSEWGMIATVAAFGFISFVVIRRRKTAAN